MYSKFKIKILRSFLSRQRRILKLPTGSSSGDCLWLAAARVCH